MIVAAQIFLNLILNIYVSVKIAQICGMENQQGYTTNPIPGK